MSRDLKRFFALSYALTWVFTIPLVILWNTVWDRALPPAELGPHVDALARRIASFPAVAIAEAKSVIAAAATGAIQNALLTEQQAFDRLMANPASERIPRMRRFLTLGCQTPEGEASIGADCVKLRG